MTIVAALQMVSSDSIAENLQMADRLLKTAAQRGARLAVLPENFSLFSTSALPQHGVNEIHPTGPVRQFLSAAARNYGLWIVGGSIPVARSPQDARVYASCFVYNELGEEVACYNKIHLFDVSVADAQGSYCESDTILPGNQAVVVETPFGKLGLAVCYDLRFPELFRIMFQQGAEIIAIPAAFTQVTGEAHWTTLLRARAIENFCTIVAADQGGKHNNQRETYGHSSIITPWGEVAAVLEKGAGVITHPINRDKQLQIRTQIPIAQHQRFFVPS